MPYVDAVIHEIQRFADVTPLGIFHASNEDVEFEGYTIPKVQITDFVFVFCFLFFVFCFSFFIIFVPQDTMVMGYVGEIHRSKKYWAKPNEFYPEHFLDVNGLLKKNIEGYLPFSTGQF